MGPHTFNFAEAAELSLAAGAAVRVADMAAGVAEAALIAVDPGDRERLAQAALSFASMHRGAAARMAAGIAERLRIGG
jgi:3-deoxy-D-manno-octulosonic-acid transferase